MKYLGIILGVVVLALAGLYAVYRFSTGQASKPGGSTAQQAAAAGTIKPPPPAPTNSTAQILQGSAAVIGALGGLSGFFGSGSGATGGGVFSGGI